MYSKIIAVDFDGTLCENKWPEIGEPKCAMISKLKKEQLAGAKLILWTCRGVCLLRKCVESLQQSVRGRTQRFQHRSH